MLPPFARYALLAVLGVAAGVALTLWLGPAALNVLVLALGIGFAALLCRSLLPRRLRPLLPSVALQGGYALWLLFGAITAGIAANVLVWLEVAALVGGLVWLCRAPTRAPAVFLLGLHTLVIVLLLAGRLASGDPGPQLPLFALHTGLRVAGCYFMLRGLNAVWRRDRRSAPGMA